MAKFTLKERLIADLRSLGWREATGNRSRYTAFVHPDKVKHPNMLFVGDNGALRSGLCASRSCSIGHATHQTPYYSLALTAGDKALDPMAAYKDVIA